LENIKKLNKTKEMNYLIEFIQSSKRGICKAKDSDEEFFS
jgi:hypothetical protein